jgi:hypothetical protein
MHVVILPLPKVLIAVHPLVPPIAFPLLLLSLPVVDLSICPLEDAIAVSEVLRELTQVLVSTPPLLDSVTFLLAFLVGTPVSVSAFKGNQGGAM